MPPKLLQNQKQTVIVHIGDKVIKKKKKKRKPKRKSAPQAPAPPPPPSRASAAYNEAVRGDLPPFIRTQMPVASNVRIDEALFQLAAVSSKLKDLEANTGNQTGNLIPAPFVENQTGNLTPAVEPVQPQPEPQPEAEPEPQPRGRSKTKRKTKLIIKPVVELPVELPVEELPLPVELTPPKLRKERSDKGTKRDKPNPLLAAEEPLPPAEEPVVAEKHRRRTRSDKGKARGVSLATAERAAQAHGASLASMLNIPFVAEEQSSDDMGFIRANKI